MAWLLRLQIALIWSDALQPYMMGLKQTLGANLFKRVATLGPDNNVARFSMHS
jgi:hypothetical protein